MNRFSIIGAGAWGTALALVAFRAGLKGAIWSISSEEVEAINQHHENVSRLPGIPLDPSLHATTDPQEASSADLVIWRLRLNLCGAPVKLFAVYWLLTFPLLLPQKG